MDAERGLSFLRSNHKCKDIKCIRRFCYMCYCALPRVFGLSSARSSLKKRARSSELRHAIFRILTVRTYGTLTVYKIKEGSETN